MSEIKRVALNTLEPQKVSDKVIKKTCKTIRISVILPESNEDNSPEYNYKDQLAAVKRKNKQTKEPNHEENGLDIFKEDDDDVVRIALEMEAKYGSGVTGKKKRKGRKDDYADIGMGYDESDSFIDNTDGYDEIIPQNVTTLHGGFYINCGALEFKTDEEASSQISSSSAGSDDEKGKPNNRKRVLETSDESDSDTVQNNTQAEKKPKIHSDKNAMQHAIKKKLFSQNKIQIKKRRPIDPLKKTVKELLREKREDFILSVPPELEKEDHLEKDPLKENKKPMSITSVTDAIESVVKQVVEESYDNNQNTQLTDINKPTETTINKLVSEPPLLTMEGESSQDQTEKRELVKLPENIPMDILEIVNKIKQAALDYRDEGKKKFFSDEVNSYLLNLERKCKILGKSSRLRVYDYLSYFCKVRKETLIRRARNLILEDEEIRLKRSTSKLKDCIANLMPALIANFEQESQKVLSKKFSADGQNEENKNLKLPKRRFLWNDEAKKLLKDIMNAKKKCLLLEGKQKDNLEELMVTFLRHSILPLWPENWMFLNNLKKVYNSMTEMSKLINNKSPNIEKSSLDKCNIDRSNMDKLNLDRSNIDGSHTDKSSADKSNIDTSLNTITPKHSNLTITPVEVKNSSAKQEVSNSVTVTKITNDVSTSSSSNKMPETMMPSSHLLKKIFNEIVKSKPDDNKTSSHSSHEKSLPEKDYTRSKLINLDLPTSKASSRQNQESFKSQTERNLTMDQKNIWPNELYVPNKEQSIPADYSSKHSRHNEEKIDLVKHSNPSKPVWPNKEPWSEDLKLKSDAMKNTRHNEMTTSSKHSSKQSKSSDNPKLISLSVNDILQKPDKHSDNSKHHSASSKHHSDSSKHYADSSKPYNDSPKSYTDSSKHYTDSSKHYSDSSKHYTDSSKHHSDTSKHQTDNSKHHSDTSKHYSDSSKHHNDGSKHYSDTKHYSDRSKHHSDSSKHLKSSDSLKLPADNNVIVLNAHQNKDADPKMAHKDYNDELKSASNSVIPKSMHGQLMDLSDGRNKSKIEDNKNFNKYSSSKDLARSDIRSSKSSDLLLANSTNYINEPLRMSHKYSDFTSSSKFLSSTPKLPRSEGDNDIQMVMENLKALQKLSCSPIKNDSTSSPVSVIAFNKNFSSSSKSSGLSQRTGDVNSTQAADFSGTFQDDFQKQFINSIQTSANPSTTKANYRCS